MKKMTVWALFDSGNGSYTKGVNALSELVKEIFKKVYCEFLKAREQT